MQRTCPAPPPYDPTVLWCCVVMGIFYTLLISQAVLEYSGISMYGHIFTWCLKLKALLDAQAKSLFERTWSRANAAASDAANTTHEPLGFKVDPRKCSTLQEVESEVCDKLQNLKKDIAHLRDTKKKFKKTEKDNDGRHDAQKEAMRNKFEAVTEQRKTEHADEKQASADHFRANHVDPTADQVEDEEEQVLRRQAEFDEELKAISDENDRQFQNFKSVYRSTKCARRADHNDVVCALNAQYLATYLHQS